MPLWNNEEELRDFAKNGAHLQAIMNSAKIAREIRTITIDATELPDWKTARELLEGAKVVRF